MKEAIQTIREKVERLSALEKSFVSIEKEVFKARDVLYFTLEKGLVVAVLEGGKRLRFEGNLNALDRMFHGLFVRTFRLFLVRVDRIIGISTRYPEEPGEDVGEEAGTAGEAGNARVADTKGFKIREECELHIAGVEETIPVTKTYARKVKKALGIVSFHHLVPEHPDDRRMRLLGLINFGWRELITLNAEDSQTVSEFKNRWDIRLFSKERMLGYFRMVGAAMIDRRRVIMNILWQLASWIKRGIEPPSDGNIRSLWYRIKMILAYHSGVLEPGDVDMYYNALTDMVEEYKLFKYKDFGFRDVHETLRGIGAKRPEIIFAAEKDGFSFFVKKVAAEVGCSFMCLMGEPAHISLEYFSDDLAARLGDKPKSVFFIPDIDNSGYSIQSNFVEGLRARGHLIERAVTLLDISLFSDEEIDGMRTPIVRYERKDSQDVPIKPASKSSLTKAKAWFEGPMKSEPRLFGKTIDGGKTIYTIYGIESDAIENKDVLRQRFLKEIGGRRR